MADSVLITGARAVVALDLARDFHKAGYCVHLADSTSCKMARSSAAITAFHRTAAPRTARYIEDILALAHAIKPACIVPTCEEVFHLARPALAAALQTKLFAPPRETLRSLHDKYRFARLAAEAGASVPETRLLQTQADLRAFAQDAAGWVFKPCFSRFGTRTVAGPSAAQLATIVPAPSDPWVAQRRIAGTEYSFYAVARDGRIAAFAAYSSTWRLQGGASFAFTPAPAAVENALLRQATALASATALTGQFSCDAIVDAAGDCWLIECNPRATSGLHLLTGSGDLARIIMGRATQPPTPNPSRHLLVALCIQGLGIAARQNRWRDWWRQIGTGRDVIGAPADRLPVAGALLDTMVFGWQAHRAGTSLERALTADMEWNGEEVP